MNRKTYRSYCNVAIGLFVVVTLLCFAFAKTAECAWKPYQGSKIPQTRSAPSLATQIGDPVGDTFPGAPVRPDIVSFSASYNLTELIVTVGFKDAISPPDGGQPDAILGDIDFDTDQDINTGSLSHVDIYSPYQSDLGVDYYLDLSDYSSASHDSGIYDASDVLVGRVPVLFQPNALTVRIPLSLIGQSSGVVNTATVMGTLDEATDAAPSGGYVTSSKYQPQRVPSLSEWSVIVCLILLSSAGVIMTRSRMSV